MAEPQPPPQQSPPEPSGGPAAESADGPRTGLDRLRHSLLRPSRGQAVAAVLVGVLGFAAVTQVRLTTVGDDYANLRESELIQALNGLQAASRQAERDISDLEETRDQLRNTSQAREAALDQAAREVQTLGVLAGTVAARGPGIRVTVEDTDGELSLTHLLDGVQELRNAGVEAMEINDRVRVTAGTSFEDGPDGIVVDDVPLRPPYVIDAVGSPSTLSGALSFDGGFIDDVELAQGEVTVREPERVDVTVLRNPTRPRYAEPVEGQ
jgi:uncharacterized protein YlxW (UPF0749 family)